MKKTTENIITQGPVWKGLLAFFFPILFGTFFQQLYNTVDAIIVGRALGKAALAAVSGGSAVFIQLLVGFFMGLSSGATISISQFYGADNKTELNRSVHTAVSLSLWAGLGISIIGVLIAPLAMKMIATPEDFFDLSVLYLRTYFVGVLPMFVYNMCSGILRSFGDSRSPFVILVIGCITNIVLDLLFVMVLPWGVMGAAWATVISQAVCMVLAIIKLMHQKEDCKFSFKKLCFTPHLLKKMIRIGIPTGIQSSLYTVSNLIIQSNVNILGTNTAAAWAAYGRIDSIFWMTVSSFGIAMSTFTGQNFGARRPERIHKAVKVSLLIVGCISVFYTILFSLGGAWVFRLFTTDEEVIRGGMQILLFIAPFFITYIPIEIFSCTIDGAGETFKTMLITMIGVCLLRVVWLFTVVPMHRTIISVVACYPVTWTITSIVFFIYYKKGSWLKAISN